MIDCNENEIWMTVKKKKKKKIKNKTTVRVCEISLFDA